MPAADRPRPDPSAHFPLATERLLLRPFEPSDADQIFETWGDPVAMRRIPSGAHPDVETSRQRIGRFMEHQARHGFSLWPVTEKASGRIVGDCGLILVELKGPDVELAYRFGRAAWGKGYATEAGRAALVCGWARGLEEITAFIDPGNARSQAVAMRLGMRHTEDTIHPEHGAVMMIFTIARP